MSAFFICRGETPIPEHKDITDPNIHETKGAAAASAGQILTATGSGSATFQTPPYSTVKVGWWDYNDVTTQTTPIPLTVVGTKYDMTNDGAGVNTQVGFASPNGTNIWKTSTNRFDFTNLAIGTTVEARFDLTIITTNANTALAGELEFGLGQPGAFIIPIFAGTNFKTAGTYQLVHSREWYIGNSLIKDNPGRIRLSADTLGATVKVNGWYLRVIRL